MNFAHFLRIEQEQRGRSRHYVVHTRDPKFSLELAPDAEATDGIGRGVIKRVCVPNSCVGDYQRCARLLAAAQEFSTASFTEPERGAGRRG